MLGDAAAMVVMGTAAALSAVDLVRYQVLHWG